MRGTIAGIVGGLVRARAKPAKLGAPRPAAHSLNRLLTAIDFTRRVP